MPFASQIEAPGACNARRPAPGLRALMGIALACTLGLAGCFGDRNVRGGAPDRVVNLPPVPDVEIPDRARTEYSQALRFIEAGNTANARAALTTMVERYPQLAGPRINLGTLLAEAGEYEQALELANAAVAAHPRSAPAYNLQGWMLRVSGDFNGAEAAYKNALEADPGYQVARLNLGVLYDLYMNRPDAALAAWQAYQQSLEASGQEPDDDVARWIADVERRSQS